MNTYYDNFTEENYLTEKDNYYMVSNYQAGELTSFNVFDSWYKAKVHATNNTKATSEKAIAIGSYSLIVEYVAGTVEAENYYINR
jgi:hypothetical protein